MVANDKFPLNNISFRLAMDIVKWFSLEGTTSKRQYSDESKKWWHMGWRLFGGKFLRLHTGMKHLGEVVMGHSEPGQFLAEESDQFCCAPLEHH